MSISGLLLGEFQEEMNKTRKTLEALPEGHGDFRSHEKSMPLAKLAGHMAQMPGFISVILTTADLDFAVTRMEPLVFETKPQILAAFDELAEKALMDLQGVSDGSFEQNWRLSVGERTIFAGTRYTAYRVFGINHMVHHRAQVGVSLRLMDEPVPSIYGPSADNAS